MYIESQSTDSVFFFYDNSRLVREEYYSGYSNRVVTYTKFEYNNQNELVKETIYSAEDNALVLTVEHRYQNGLNVKTEIFNNHFKNDKMREVRRYYDRNDNLIYLESIELAIYSSATSFVSKYEYY